MADSGMNEITRFERYSEVSSPPRAVAPPPISPEAMAAVAKANRLARNVSNELPLEWPQSPWVGRPVLAFAIVTVIGLAGALGYYIVSEGQGLLEKSRKTAEVTDSVSTQSAAALRESTDSAPLPPPIPPTAPIRMGQWVPDPTSQGQGQPTPNYAHPQAITPAAPVAQIQPMAQAIHPAPMPVAPAPVAQRPLAQTAPQLNTTQITISSAAPIPAPGEPQIQAQTLPQPQIPVQIQPQPESAHKPVSMVGPQAPRIANPKEIEASIADEPAEGTPQPVPLVIRIRTKEARFHSGPGVQYPIIAVARAETRYAVADWSDRWFKVAIRLPAGTTMGWIRNDQVLITPGGKSERLPAYDSASNANDEIE